jgi:hypothetical protein
VPARERETEPPDAVPGTFLRASVYDDHFVTFGLEPTLDVLFSGDLILKPLAPKAGRNLVTFARAADLVKSGFCWPSTVPLLAETPYVVTRTLGRGHVVAFTANPNFRAACPTTQRLFLNAVVLGPAH